MRDAVRNKERSKKRRTPTHLAHRALEYERLLKFRRQLAQKLRGVVAAHAAATFGRGLR